MPHRLLVACNAAAASESTRIFLYEVFRWQRKQARRKGLKKPRTGAVSFSQRFGSKLNLHFHHHAVLPEGVFVEVEGKVLFEKLDRPQRSDLEAILERVASKTLAMVRRRGLLDEEPPSDALAVFGPGAWWRKRIVPKTKPSPGPAAAPPNLAELRPPYRLPWSLLLARTFALDILRSHCGGERKLLAVVSEPRAAQEALERLGLPSTRVEVSPARWPTQDGLDLPRDYGGADPPFFDDVA